MMNDVLTRVVNDVAAKGRPFCCPQTSGSGGHSTLSTCIRCPPMTNVQYWRLGRRTSMQSNPSLLCVGFPERRYRSRSMRFRPRSGNLTADTVSEVEVMSGPGLGVLAGSTASRVKTTDGLGGMFSKC